MSLMTSHPGAKRLSSIQTGLMVSLSHWLEWKAVKWLCPGVNTVVIGVGTHVLLVLMENLPHRPLRVKILSSKLDVSSMHEQIRKRNTKVWNIYKIKV